MENNTKMAGEEVLVNSQNELDKTTHTAGADRDLGVEKDCQNSNDLKNEKLQNAYNSLQSEFTRRCQKIKELERENSVLKEEQSKMNSSTNADMETYEKDFIKNYPEVLGELQSLKDLANSLGDKSYGRLERAYLNSLKQKLEEKENYYKSQKYLLDCIRQNENLKESVIREYLEGVQGSKPTVRLTSGDGMASITPPSKPKTLAEAGIIAQQILEKFKEI